MAKETIQIADKPTLDRILEFLLGDEAGLAVLKSLLIESADKAESTTDDIKEVNRAVDTISGYLTNNTYGLNAIKTAISGRANESTSTAIKSLLENGTYGLNALKTAVGSSNKFSSTTAGVLQINSTLSQIGTTVASQKLLAAYSSEMSISGNGQIVFYDTNKPAPTTISVHVLKLVDIVVDGYAVPTTKTTDSSADAFTLYANGSSTNISMLFPRKVEFSKSFKCKIGYFGSLGTSYDSNNRTCVAEAKYYLQLR